MLLENHNGILITKNVTVWQGTHPSYGVTV